MNKAEEFLRNHIREGTTLTPRNISGIMEIYAQQVSRENAINFAGFYYDSVADNPTPKEITPEMLYDIFNQNQQ